MSCHVKGISRNFFYPHLYLVLKNLQNEANKKKKKKKMQREFDRVLLKHKESVRAKRCREGSGGVGWGIKDIQR